MSLIVYETLDDKGNYYECKGIQVIIAKFMGTMYLAHNLATPEFGEGFS